jgi:hypothetical protein
LLTFYNYDDDDSDITAEVNMDLNHTSGKPAKNRGINFDKGSENAPSMSYIEVENVLLHYSFVIQSWINIRDQDATITLFSKDRNAFEPNDNSSNNLWI